MMNDIAKSFDILTTSLNVLHNYFDSPKNVQICIYKLNFEILQQNRSFCARKLTEKTHELSY